MLSLEHRIGIYVNRTEIRKSMLDTPMRHGHP